MKKLLLFLSIVLIILQTNHLIVLLKFLDKSYYYFSDNLLVYLKLALYGVGTSLICFILWQNEKIKQTKEDFQSLLFYNKYNEKELREMFQKIRDVELTKNILDEIDKNKREELEKILNREFVMNPRKKIV